MVLLLVRSAFRAIDEALEKIVESPKLSPAEGAWYHCIRICFLILLGDSLDFPVVIAGKAFHVLGILPSMYQ